MNDETVLALVHQVADVMWSFDGETTTAALAVLTIVDATAAQGKHGIQAYTRAMREGMRIYDEHYAKKVPE